MAGKKLSANVSDDLRPPIWVGHVVLESNRLDESAQFMLTIGMRPIYQGPSVAIFELRGGTHLIIIPKTDVAGGDAKFDLMVEDLHATTGASPSWGSPRHRSKPCRTSITSASRSGSRPGISSPSSRITSPAIPCEAPT